MMYTNFKGFNIRVYAICVKNNKVLALKELFAGIKLIKFPGGGLEFGEGTVDCLIREFKEELNLNILVKDAFYIQESFIPSLAKDQKQLLTLYFYVDILNLQDLIVLDKNIEEVLWIDLTNENPFSLPVDKIVFDKLKTKI